MMNLWICVLALVAYERGIQAGEIDDVKAELIALMGVNYIHWGCTVCPASADKLYQGYIAKSRNTVGGGAEYVCLHDDPEWPEEGKRGITYNSRIYNVEFQDVLGGAKFENFGAPCAACVVTGRSQMIMIPGRVTCSAGWTLEYQGALAAEHYQTTKSTYVCLDRNPETITGSDSKHDGSFLYTVEAGCYNSELCPPYVHGQEIACAVCTK